MQSIGRTRHIPEGCRLGSRIGIRANLARLMSDPLDHDEGMRDRLSSRGEDALGDLANTLLDNPVFNQALSAAMGAREKALEAQRAAMGALDISSGSEVERLERRLRSLSDRLEAVEEQLDELAQSQRAAVSTDQAKLEVDP
jgi:chromosome segregation ATPase